MFHEVFPPGASVISHMVQHRSFDSDCVQTAHLGSQFSSSVRSSQSVSSRLNRRRRLVRIESRLLPQCSSSEPSTQSPWRSHLRSRCTHSPLAQENCLAEQGLGTGGRTVLTAGLDVEPGEEEPIRTTALVCVCK